jgi:uncharacterized surface protein with fasciclin (FAS1) repeats
MFRKTLLLCLVALLSLIPLGGAGAQEDLPTIAEIAAGDENFSILVEALTQAGLVETFAGEGEFTVFAPTNAAFEALPPGMLQGVLSSPPSLAAVLGYHVVEGTLLAEDIAAMEILPSTMGAPLAVTVNEDGSITLNGTVNVVTADIQASNGVIHVIDAVLVPERPGQGGGEAPAAEEEAGNTLVDVVAATENLAFLNTAFSLAPAGLVAALKDTENQFILFAPSDAAFTALDEELRTAAIADPALLASILLLHVTPYDGMPMETVMGFLASQTEAFPIDSLLPESPLGLSLNEEGGLLVNEVLTGEIIEADNGLVIIIEAVLIPAEGQLLSAEALAELFPATEGEDGMGEESGMDSEGPALDENWAAVASGFGMSELDTADDFFVTVVDPFAAGADNELYGVEIINWTADYRYTGFIIEQFLPAEVLIWMAEQDPSVWEGLSDSVLKKLPAEELAKLPAEVQARVQ